MMSFRVVLGQTDPNPRAHSTPYVLGPRGRSLRARLLIVELRQAEVDRDIVWRIENHVAFIGVRRSEHPNSGCNDSRRRAAVNAKY